MRLGCGAQSSSHDIHSTRRPRQLSRMAACASSPEQTKPKSACGSKPRPGRRLTAKSRRRDVLLSTISFLPAAANRLKQSSAPARERFPSWSTPNWSRSTASYWSAISHKPGTTVPLLRTGPASRGRARLCMLPTWVVLTLTARRAIGSASISHESSIPNLKLTLQKKRGTRLGCTALPATVPTSWMRASAQDLPGLKTSLNETALVADALP